MPETIMSLMITLMEPISIPVNLKSAKKHDEELFAYSGSGW